MDEHNKPGEVVIEGLSKSFDQVTVLEEIDLKVKRTETLSLLGPSGCGKTTLLRTIAGLEQPEKGQISVSGKVVFSETISVPPEKRKIGMVFQDAALFPHMSISENIGYGIRKKISKEKKVAELLEFVGLSGFGDRRPHTLSGGQKQRVALARALAPEPSVLLLDEPFSNLDSTLRVEIRSEVNQLLTSLEITTIFVTHDQDEAFVLGNRVAVMREGRLIQIDPPHDLYRQPVDGWVAGFVGDANIFPFNKSVNSVCSTPIGEIPVLKVTDNPSGVLIRPEELKISEGNDGIVEIVEYYGHDAMVLIRLKDGTLIKARTPAGSNCQRGDQVSVSYVGMGAALL